MSFYEGSDPDVDYSGANFIVAVAAAWAGKLDGPVQNDDYSAKYNANLAADSAAAAAGSAAAADAAATVAEEAAGRLDEIVLADLVDVATTPPGDTNVLAWNEANQLWEPTVISMSQTASVNALIAQMTELRQKLIEAGIITP